MNSKKVFTYIGCFIALVVVGRLVYTRVMPSPETQELHNAAQEIDRKLEELKSSQTPFVIPPGSYETAMERGMGAATDAQTAKTKGEWGLVMGQWESAIDNLKRIPATDLNYAKAQKKLIEYQKNLAYAEQVEETAPY